MDSGCNQTETGNETSRPEVCLEKYQEAPHLEQGANSGLKLGP